MTIKQLLKEFDEITSGVCWNPECKDSGCQEDRKEVRAIVPKAYHQGEAAGREKGYNEALEDREEINNL